MLECWPSYTRICDFPLNVTVVGDMIDLESKRVSFPVRTWSYISLFTTYILGYFGLHIQFDVQSWYMPV
jgi:hypothetical protein